VFGIGLLFHFGMLPHSTARIVGRLYFWPMLPFTVIIRSILGDWWDQVDEGIYLGSIPIAMLGHIDALYKLGVRSVINMCDEYDGPSFLYAKKGIVQLRLPTVDHFEPSVEVIQKAINFIKQRREKGEAVYIHCRAGHGRSAAVALCWLIFDKKMTPKDAQEWLSQRRNVRTKLWKQSNINQFYLQLRQSHQ